MQIQLDTSAKMETSLQKFQLIELTIWTICAFRVLNPHQLSLAEQSIVKFEMWCPDNAKQFESKQGKAKIDCIHLLLSLEGYMKICSTQKSNATRKLKHDLIRHRAFTVG